MAPKLNVEGKHALLKQSFKFHAFSDSKTFMKILFVNKCFINLASSYSVYRFEVKFGANYLSICFENGHSISRSRVINMAPERAQRLFCFLKPKILIAAGHVYTWKKLIDFMGNSDCKIVMSDVYAAEIPPVDIIERIWPRVVEMRLHASHMSNLNKLPTKNFEKLEIKNICTLDELKEALQQNTKNLDLTVDHYIVGDTTDSRIRSFVLGNIKRCRVFFFDVRVICRMLNMLSCLRDLDKLLQSGLTHLEVEVYCYKENRNFSPNSAVVRQNLDVKYLKKIARIPNKDNINWKIGFFSAHSCTYNAGVDWTGVFKNDTSFKNFWINILKDKLFPEDLKIEVKGKTRIYLKQESQIGNVTIKFNSSITNSDNCRDYRPNSELQEFFHSVNF